jgi:tetratricopeptide (TPR) repeat protein
MSPAALALVAAIFVDATADSGLAFRHSSGAAGDYFFPEIMGAGVGLLDYDGDGDLDVYLVQSGDSATTGGDRLYRNDLEPAVAAGGSGPRRLRFTDTSAAAGVGDGGYGMGVAAGDYDHDGWTDVFVAGLGRDRLLRNLGGGAFEDATERAGVSDPRWSVSASFVDFDRDGWLDLFVAEYVDATRANHKRCRAAAGHRDYCGPLSYRPVPSRLLRNQRDGTFRDVSAAAGLHAAFGGALGVVAVDLDRDGWLDLYVANDQTRNQLWRNRGDGTFEDEALERGVALDVNGQPQASMGVDAGDFDGDGDDDLFLSHLAGETDTLYVNDGAGVFLDGTAGSGLAPPGLAYTGFGTAWLDYDGDGRLDLLVVNGAVNVVEALVARRDPHPFHQPDQLLRNLGDGRFEDRSAAAGPALALAETGRGAAFGDLDDDGDTDVVVTNNEGPARVLLNQVGNLRAWLGLRLVGRTAGGSGDRDQLGARVELARDRAPPLVRRARADGSYASANDPRVLFGLGRPPDAAHERVRVTWPDGMAERFERLAAGRYHTLRRGEGTPDHRVDGEPTAAAAAPAGDREAPLADADRDAAGTAPEAVAETTAEPDPTRFEPAVAAQIAAARDAVATADAGAMPAERARALGELARVYHAYELFDAAADGYRRADALDAAGGRWAYLLGALEHGRGRPREAIAALERALAADPRSLAAWLRLGDQLLELGRVREAGVALERAAVIAPDEPAVLYGLGRAAQAERDWSTARAMFERALALQPEATLVHYALGQTCRELGDDDAARRHLALAGHVPVRFRDDEMAAVGALARGSAAHLAAGGRAFALGDWESAIAEHRRALEADPESVEARRGLVLSLLAAGDRHARDGDVGGALVHYDAALRIEPGRVDVAVKRTTALYLGGRADEAKAALERALAAAPRDVLARTAMARLLASAPEPALRDGERALALARSLFAETESVENAELMAMACAETGDFAQAIGWQRRALDAAVAAGAADLAAALRRNLDRYQRGETCCA